ncbi:hypothetical protein E4U21_001406 [Claviceps maximensis]|nr:hypothetical protein E4U21_001406 [Claviceps maximensis]
MPNSTSGQLGRPDDSQCYNCGLVGHWAVACPEPTRATPAGLMAWRNSSNPSPPNLKGQGSTSNKRSKGPIITKYVTPVSQFPPGIGHVPPPPGHHLHPHPHPQPPPPSLSTYPSQTPPYHQSYSPPPPLPAPPPPPSYAGTFPPPPPPPYGYPNPPYTTPPLPHATSHYGPPGYRGPLPGPPPPLHPPPGGQFHSNRIDGQDYRPQYHHNHGFSRSPPPPHSSPSTRSTPPQRRSNSRSKSGPLKPPTLPPKPPAGIVAYPLPPKPPKSHDQMNSHQDHRNKRKHDRQNKGRDRRQSNDQHQRTSNFGPHRDFHSQRAPENRRSNGSAQRGQRQNQGGPNARNQSYVAAAPVEKAMGGSQGQNGSRRSSNDHAAPPTSSAEKIDGKSDEEESARKPTNSLAERSIDVLTNEKNIEEKQNKKGSEASNIKLSTGNPEDSDQESLSDYHEGSNSSKHPYDQQNDSELHQRETKLSRLDGSFRVGKDHTDTEQGEECLWKTLGVPREADRRQQTGMDHLAARKRDSGDSRASRHSSPSSQSSDLNSLEAELLGRPVKQKSPAKPNARHRGEHVDARLRTKRRRTNTNSAYSRRW